MMDGILVTPVTLVGYAFQIGSTVHYIHVLKFLWLEIIISAIVQTISFTN